MGADSERDDHNESCGSCGNWEGSRRRGGDGNDGTFDDDVNAGGGGWDLM